MPVNKTKSFRILDGGLATELERQGYALNDDLWSARLLIDHPESIVAVHRQYLEAGADVITSSSYQATTDGFQQIGMTSNTARELICRSVQLARQACQEFAAEHPECQPCKVAAGIGPFGAALADGSEYSGNYAIGSDQLYEFHHDRWHLLLSKSPDLVLCETTPSLEEAKALIRLAHQTELPVWMSFSCRNESEISDGTPMVDIAREIVDSPVHGIGINCTPPSLILPLVREIRKISNVIPIVVYPNSGETFEVDSRNWSGIADLAAFTSMAVQWLDEDVQMIGGCCRTTPVHIRELHRLRDNQMDEISRMND